MLFFRFSSFNHSIFFSAGELELGPHLQVSYPRVFPPLGASFMLGARRVPGDLAEVRDVDDAVNLLLVQPVPDGCQVPRCGGLRAARGNSLIIRTGTIG